MVSYLGYDAINNKLRTIVTSCGSDNPLRVYNYFQRGWTIDYVSRLSLNEDAKENSTSAGEKVLKKGNLDTGEKTSLGWNNDY